MSTVTTTAGRIYLPSPVADSLSSRALTFLVPFDIGQTFIFKSSKADPSEDWNSIFKDHVDAENWSTDQKELAGFKNPMGWIATWRYFEGTAKPRLNAAFAQLQANIPGELETGRDGIRAIVFPNGIGILIVRIKAASLDDPSYRDDVKRKLRREACRPFLATIAACYLDFMYQAVMRGAKNGTRFVERLRPVGRKHGIVRAEYTYPLYFFDSDEIAKWFSSGDAPPVYSYGSAKLFIGWRDATIYQGADIQRDKIERNFVIALAGWFALFVMNNRSTHYILNAIHALASYSGDAEAIDGGAIRLAYIEASNQAFPIQWTSSGSDLLLLEAIHDSWNSNRWWKNVESKTRLLAAYSEQIEADTNEHWNQRIAGVGTTIACFTLSSAIADILSVTGGPMPLKLGLIIGLPALLGLLLGIFVWKSLSRPARRPELRSDYDIPSNVFELGETASTSKPVSGRPA